MENVFGLITIGLGSMALRAFESDTLEIPEVGFGNIKGSKPQIVGAMTVPY